MIHIDLIDFVLRGIIGSFSAQSTRDHILGSLGPADSPSYPDHVVYGNLCFDLMNGGPLALVQILFPHEIYSHCPHQEWETTWHPPRWLTAWPDDRFSWELGPFVPAATVLDVTRAITELQKVEPEKSLWRAYGDGVTLIVPGSDVMIDFDALRAGDVLTLSRITGSPQSVACVDPN